MTGPGARTKDAIVNTLLNLIWLVLSGLWMALGYALAGVIFCITIVGIPFGIAAFRIGLYALWPFGRTVVDKPSAGAGSLIGNLIWLVLAGWWLALGHITLAISLGLTIIGIPFAIQHLKLAYASLFPIGQTVVDADVVQEARRNRAATQVQQMRQT